MRGWLFAAMAVLAACVPGPGATTQSGLAAVGQTARILFVGDVMLGRAVAPVAAREGPGLFEDIRFVVSSADLALANLESPLTEHPHLGDNENALEADPASAHLLAGAGFGGISLANNHSGDAGPLGLLDTMAALKAEGLVTLGAGRNRAEAESPVIVDVNGIRLGLLAFDVTGLGLVAADKAGVASYNSGRARTAIESAGDETDIIIVSLHGGVEYLPEIDPILDDMAADLVGWGADVVWGHGSHVVQPVTTTTGPSDRAAVVATSLGNFLFDQQPPPTQIGGVLEVLVSVEGVGAYRLGRAGHGDLRVRFEGWEIPEGPAVLLDGEWWDLVGSPALEPTSDAELDGFPMGDVIASGLGDVTGDGVVDLVVSFRRPFRSNQVNSLYPEWDLIDARGRSAHLGVFAPGSFDQIWVAGTLERPAAEVAVCDGSLALAFDSLDDGEIVATGAWTWWGFGFATAPTLLGAGRAACADVDRDGEIDPIILER